MSEQEGAARRRRVANPWVLALHGGGVLLVAAGLVLHELFWKDSLLGMYAGYGSELASGMTEEQFLRTLAAGQFAMALVPVCIGAGIAAVLGALGLQAVAWEQRMRMRAPA